MPDRIVRVVTLVGINTEIAEREQYRREQEAIIQGVINDGNNYLLNLNYQIEAAKKELKAKKAKLYELSKEAYEAEQDLQQLREDIKAELKSASFLPGFSV